AEILRGISRSPNYLPPVLDTVVAAAARFCGAPNVVMTRLDGDMLRAVAAAGPFADDVARNGQGLAEFDIPASSGSVTGSAVVERRTIHVPDLAVEPEHRFPIGLQYQRRLGHRAMVATPLLREGMPIGTLALFRTEPRAFTAKQIDLLQTF